VDHKRDQLLGVLPCGAQQRVVVDDTRHSSAVMTVTAAENPHFAAMAASMSEESLATLARLL